MELDSHQKKEELQQRITTEYQRYKAAQDIADIIGAGIYEHSFNQLLLQLNDVVQADQDTGEFTVIPEAA